MNEFQIRLGRLVERCRKGDSGAWSELVSLTQGPLATALFGTGLGREDVEDLSLYAYTSLYQNLNKLSEPGTVLSWLLVTAKREAWRRARQMQRQKTGALEDLPAGGELLAAEESEDVAEAMDVASRSALLQQGMSQLKERCRQILSAIYSEPEESYEEISAKYGIPIGSIGPTRARCLESLRKILSDYEFFDDVSNGGESNSL